MSWETIQPYITDGKKSKNVEKKTQKGEGG